jgi:hypothetical protein
LEAAVAVAQGRRGKGGRQGKCGRGASRSQFGFYGLSRSVRLTRQNGHLSFEKRGCQNGQASSTVPGGIPGSHSGLGEGGANTRGAHESSSLVRRR